MTRLRLCSKLGLTHVRVPDDYSGSQIVGLGEPPEMGCKSELALGSGLCWFSTIYYLLVGKKSGKSNKLNEALGGGVLGRQK